MLITSLFLFLQANGEIVIFNNVSNTKSPQRGRIWCSLGLISQASIFLISAKRTLIFTHWCKINQPECVLVELKDLFEVWDFQRVLRSLHMQLPLTYKFLGLGKHGFPLLCSLKLYWSSGLPTQRWIPLTLPCLSGFEVEIKRQLTTKGLKFMVYCTAESSQMDWLCIQTSASSQ